MSFLKKLGSALLKATQIVAGVTPTITTAFPGSATPIQVISRDLAQVADAITQIETLGQVLNLGGADKLKAAAPLVAQIILQSPIMAGGNRKIADPTLFQAGCVKIASGMADVLNSLHESGVDTQDKVA